MPRGRTGKRSKSNSEILAQLRLNESMVVPSAPRTHIRARTSYSDMERALDLTTTKKELSPLRRALLASAAWSLNMPKCHCTDLEQAHGLSEDLLIPLLATGPLELVDLLLSAPRPVAADHPARLACFQASPSTNMPKRSASDLEKAHGLSESVLIPLLATGPLELVDLLFPTPAPAKAASASTATLIPSTDAALDGSLVRLFATPRRTTNNGDAALDGLCLDLLFPEASLAAATTAPTPVPTPAPEPAPMRLSLSSSKTQDDAAAPVSLLSLPAPALKRRPRFTLFSGLRRACAEVGGTMLGLAVAGASMVVGSRSPAATAPKAEAEAPMSAPSAAGGLESAHREEEDQQGEEEETMLAEDACVEMYDLDPPAAPLTLAGRVAKAYGRLCWGLRATRKAFLEAAAALHMAAHVVCVMCFDYGGLCMTPPDVVWERDGELYS